MISSPDSGSVPTIAGQVEQLQRGVEVDLVDRMRLEQRRGARLAARPSSRPLVFGGFCAVSTTSPVAGVDGCSAASGSGSSSVTYGPKRPSLTTTCLPLSGFTPSTRSPATGASMSSRALLGVSSSGARSSGRFTRRGVASGCGVGIGDLEVRPVLADAQRDVVGAICDRVDLAGVDVAEVVDDAAQPAVGRPSRSRSRSASRPGLLRRRRCGRGRPPSRR